MDKLNIAKVNGEVLTAEEFNSVVDRLNTAIEVIEKMYLELNLKGLNINFVTQEEYTALVNNNEIDPTAIYLLVD